VLHLIADKALSTSELSGVLNQKSISGHLKKVLAKLRNDKLIEWSEQVQKSSKQRYQITQRGLVFLKLIKKNT